MKTHLLIVMFWLPREVAKCVIFLLKINTGIEASRTRVQKASFDILHIQGAQGWHQMSMEGREGRGQKRDFSSLGSL